jgi:hypothetical protein
MQIKPTKPGFGIAVNPHWEFIRPPYSNYPAPGNPDCGRFNSAHPELPLINPDHSPYHGVEGEILEGRIVWQQSTFTNGWEEITEHQYNYHYENHSELNQPIHKVRKIYIITPKAEKPEETEETDYIPVSMGVANGIDPCPLCGGKEGESVILGYKHPYYRITCTDCSLIITDDRKDKVQGKWNTRNGVDFWQKQNTVSKERVIEVIQGTIDGILSTDKQCADYEYMEYQNKTLTDLINQIKAL